ncbi:hypothetical protein [Streptomyces sp. SAI-149]|uniref:hypothetical protein n=1 Tax=Streptomyces sp. SAI-149 TaxID=2940542 RepID=UPI0024742C3A|nr:hypothetical protein [Streptomyces sp. SAI-149]MDH6502437.1 hypothetical protein [Streptomyces sp. SAI-149]
MSIVTLVGFAVGWLALGAAFWQGYLLRRQVAHGETLSRAHLYREITRLFVDLDMFMIDHADLRPYFFEAQALPEDSEQRSRVIGAAEMIADVAESCTAVEDVLGELSSSWDRYFQYVFANSPALQFYWREFGEFYPPRVWRSFGLTRL